MTKEEWLKSEFCAEFLSMVASSLLRNIPKIYRSLYDQKEGVAAAMEFESAMPGILGLRVMVMTVPSEFSIDETKH